MRDGVNSPALTSPVGPFSHAVKFDGLIYLSGQVAQDPGSGQLLEGDAGIQTEQIFKNLQLLLKDLGRDLAHVLKVNVYLTSMSDFGLMNSIYARHFTAPYPARTTVAVAALPLGARVEMELIVADRE
jgi:2-iminobutanoate/2-iminopropanoate deaminase